MTTTTSHRAFANTFDGHGDVGEVKLAGDAMAGDDRLVVKGSGHNMWLEEDEFHFVWSELRGDWSLSASPRFRGQGANAHRKAVLLARESLDTNAAYAGIALHGDGLTSLQYRARAGAITHEIRFRLTAPTRLTVRKIGDRVEVVADDEGHAVQLSLPETYYLGVAVCSHTDDILETVDFTEIELSRVDHE